MLSWRLRIPARACRRKLQAVHSCHFYDQGSWIGDGAGLSMVYGFAKQSGGLAKIDSEVGHGTVVKIYLPAIVTTASELESTVAHPQPDNGNHPRSGG